MCVLSVLYSSSHKHLVKCSARPLHSLSNARIRLHIFGFIPCRGCSFLSPSPSPPPLRPSFQPSHTERWVYGSFFSCRLSISQYADACRTQSHVSHKLMYAHEHTSTRHARGEIIYSECLALKQPQSRLQGDFPLTFLLLVVF